MRCLEYKCSNCIFIYRCLFIIRELKEESGLDAVEMYKAGILIFQMGDDLVLRETHVFVVNKYSGTPTESEGMLQ